MDHAFCCSFNEYKLRTGKKWAFYHFDQWEKSQDLSRSFEMTAVWI